MSDCEKEKVENPNISIEPLQNISLFKKYRWSILTVTVLAIASGIYVMTLNHVEQELSTNEDYKEELNGEEVHMKIVKNNETNIHSYTSFTNGISKFTSDFYQKSIQGSSGNVIISPLSVQGIGKTTLAILNQIYVQECYEINADFQDVAEKKFLSGVELVDFEDSIDTAEYINQFVKRKTNNKIKDLIEPHLLNSNTRAILVNAVSFKGMWLDEFEKPKTHKGDFYNTESETVLVDYMYKESQFNYAVFDSLDAAAVQMRYRNSNFSFIILLPRTIDGLSALEDKIKHFNLTKIVDKMQFKWIELKVPKFKIEFDINLNDILKNLGMTEMFTSKANFSGLLESRQTNEPLYVSNVIHKTAIEINEQGTDAYSATASALILSGGINAIKFLADHPFFFYIWDNQTKNAVFSGRVTQFD
ncbi:serine protease inhibitor 42Dd-like isoform X2 [Sitodiplosis mosellana]|uniref:serine protease inhibitor 42Dd-like isoform X2 n=1 Tax=Sitodiplosis mosellana TaxID=263140 RepID=UPI002443DA64|nr:serine protease inhibitor 42Dd-like isoform X2 [Sitodiplosis mosellana]